MYVALERFINLDHKKEWKQWEDKIALINNNIKTIAGVSTEVVVPPTDNNMPTLQISWDPDKIPLTHTQMGGKLRSGDPAVEVISWEKDHTIRVAMHCLQDGEEKIVARRLKEELISASK
jgi:seryl-tRNA(Sec) selenium transferase